MHLIPFAGLKHVCHYFCFPTFDPLSKYLQLISRKKCNKVLLLSLTGKMSHIKCSDKIGLKKIYALTFERKLIGKNQSLNQPTREDKFGV